MAVRIVKHDELKCINCGHPHDLKYVEERIDKMVKCNKCEYYALALISRLGFLYTIHVKRYRLNYERNVRQLAAQEKLVDRIIDRHIIEHFDKRYKPEKIRHLVYTKPRIEWVKKVRKGAVTEALYSGVRVLQLMKIFTKKGGTIAKSTIRKYAD